jgi:hypothetical protein
MTSYDKYVKHANFLAFYNDYQKRYAGQIAERDKVMLGLVAPWRGCSRQEKPSNVLSD